MAGPDRRATDEARAMRPRACKRAREPGGWNLEVEARGELTDTRIVGLDKVAGWVGRRIRAGGRSCIGGTKPSRTAPFGRIEDVEELAADLEAHSFTNGELLEERHVDQWVKLLTNVENGAVGLRGVCQPRNKGSGWRRRIAGRHRVVRVRFVQRGVDIRPNRYRRSSWNGVGRVGD